MKNILVVSPHPDDETLGCGGTLLKLKAQGNSICWLIATEISEKFGWDNLVVEKRNNEIESVADKYGFDNIIRMGLPSIRVDSLDINELIEKVSNVLIKIKPNTIFLPFINDVHTDHYYISRAFLSCCKWFRYPFIKNVLYYETISETDFNINSCDKTIRPNVYVDISNYIDKKLEIIKIYNSEINEFPFPRSLEAIKSLALLRGSQCGAIAAEAFELLRCTL